MAYVYVLKSGDENIFKVGRTKNDVDARILQLATGSPYRLTKFEVIETDHDKWCEKYLHGRLSTKRVRSGPAKEFFAVTPSELISVLNEARIYLDECLPVVLEAEKIAGEDSDGSEKAPGNEEQSIYQELLELKEQRAKLEARYDYLESQLKVLMGVAQVLEGIAVWKTQIGNHLDQSAFRLQEPEMWGRYQKQSKTRPFRLEK